MREARVGPGAALAASGHEVQHTVANLSTLTIEMPVPVMGVVNRVLFEFIRVFVFGMFAAIWKYKVGGLRA